MYVKKKQEKLMTFDNAIRTQDVGKLKDYIFVGEKVKAEIFIPPSGTGTGDFGTTDVVILEKYPHFAVTDKGDVTWNNIAIHNRSLMNRIKNTPFNRN